MAVAAAVLMAGIAGTAYWAKQPKPIMVHTAIAQESSPTSDKTLLNASGYVTARREATISAKDTGKVVEVLVEEGMKVEADQVLARIDSSNIERNLQEAQAQLESSQKSLEETKPGLDNALRDQQRFEQLAASDFASKSDLDRYTTSSKALQARLNRQQADIAVAEKTVAIWKQQLDDATIRAPFAGVVISKDAQPGEMISPISAGGGFTRTGICTIVDMNSLEIDVDVNESYIQRVQSGQPVVATLDAYPDWQIPAKVIAIVPTADRQKATVRVRVAFEKLDPRILPDMSIKVAFQNAEMQTTATPTHDIFVSKSAIHDQNGKQIIWLLRDGHAEARSITSGAAHGDEVVVATGLNAGEKIILDETSPLADGAIVTEAKP